jgi:8-oxo-dGTP diphosphatase
MKIELLARGVLIRDGHLLLAVSKKKKHLFLPGGHVEFAEPARSALVREIKEETGFIVSVGKLLGVVEHSWKTNKKLHAEINLLFSISSEALDTLHPPVSKEKKISFTWHPLNRLGSINFQPAILRTRLPAWISATVVPGWASTLEQ